MKRIGLFALGAVLIATIGWLATPTRAIQYTVPAGAVTPIIASSGNKAAAEAVATIPAVAGKVAYLEGFDITSSGSTAAAVVTVAVAGSGTTQSYTYSSVAGVAAPNAVLSVRFPTPIPASAVNTAFTVTMPSLGSGNTNATVVAYGFYQ